MVVYDGTEINRNEVRQLAEGMTTTNAITPLMLPCLGEILGRSCTVVAKVRDGYLSIKALFLGYK